LGLVTIDHTEELMKAILGNPAAMDGNRRAAAAGVVDLFVERRVHQHVHVDAVV
jgi:hypothetical protein